MVSEDDPTTTPTSHFPSMRGTLMNGEETEKWQRNKKGGNKKYLFGDTNVTLL